MQSIIVERHLPRLFLTKALSPLWPDFIWTPLSASGVRVVDDLPLPGPRWIRVRNLACGICATDLSLLYVDADLGIAPAALPASRRFSLGHESVGVVVEVGSGVTHVKVGERVIMDAHFLGGDCRTLEIDPPCRMCAEQEYHFCLNRSHHEWHGFGGGFGDTYLTHELAVYPCPPELSRDQAVLVEPLSVGVHGVLRFPPDPGDKVLVLGMGAIGLMILIALKAVCPECEITALARYPFQAEMAERMGAQHILSGDRNAYQTVAQLTGGTFFSAPLNKGLVTGGFDVIYDCVGTKRTINDSLRWTRAGGTVVLIGAHLAPMANVDLSPVWYHQVNLVGSVSHGFDEFDGKKKHSYGWVYDFFLQGCLETDGLITHRFPLSDYKSAIRVASEPKGKTKAIKVLFEYD
jgi:threonine dehydrogenase-like Zn-dependent dehydrogenase